MPSDVVLVGLREGLGAWGLRQGGVALAAGDLGAFLGDPGMGERRWSTPMNETERILGWTGEMGWPRSFVATRAVLYGSA